PSLLPAFEPSSSPLPHSHKRKLDSTQDVEPKFYPTPVPTSSTGVLPSSPVDRPQLQRAVSNMSERVPLGAVPTIELPPNGEPLLLGRSGNSSNYQLSVNRAVSRVHIRATYHEPDSSHASGSVLIECLGWNGAKVHCKGHIILLAKDESFTADVPAAEIMIDVQDTRVIVAWPGHVRSRSASAQSDSTWDDNSSPRRVIRPTQNRIVSSPPAMEARSISPSPTPVNRSNASALETFNAALDSNEAPRDQPIAIYEDSCSDPEVAEADRHGGVESSHDHVKSSPSSSHSSDDLSEHDEENDPIVHSFGPFGENIIPRLESFSTSASIPPQRRREPLQATGNSPQKPTSTETAPRLSSPGLGVGPTRYPPPKRSFDESPVRNHVINQLAFSRVHAIPLSTILGTLPAELKGVDASSATFHPKSPAATTLTSSVLKNILDGIPCVGEITREGKDAAGKPLENEYYYVPEMDADSMRRETVEGSRGGGLRSVRKNHKQYFWKRPR
ncbi:hypothetical protein NA57DRAFT_24948, partial [Rhizodiscina lignyota]